MKTRLLLTLLLTAAGVVSGAAGTKEMDQILKFTKGKPCWLDKYRYFCCPIVRIVRRGNVAGKWMDYCYNDRDELIGLRRGDNSGRVKTSSFTALGGNCTRCNNSRMEFKHWRHDTAPKLAPPKKKKKK